MSRDRRPGPQKAGPIASDVTPALHYRIDAWEHAIISAFRRELLLALQAQMRIAVVGMLAIGVATGLVALAFARWL